MCVCVCVYIYSLVTLEKVFGTATASVVASSTFARTCSPTKLQPENMLLKPLPFAQWSIIQALVLSLNILWTTQLQHLKVDLFSW